MEAVEVSDEVFWRKDGTAVPVTYRATLVQDGSGKPTGIVTTFHDISQQVAAEKEKEVLRLQMEHTQRLESLGVLAGGIAHDFNNLLSVILGNVEIARSKICQPCGIEAPLNRVEKAGHRAADLCRQMLAYAGEGRFSVQPLNLSSSVREMGELLATSMQEGVHVKYRLGHPLPLIEADQAQVQQVVMNLLTNASEAMEGKYGGTVEVRTGLVYLNHADIRSAYGSPEGLEAGDFVFLEVKDQGCGMSKEVQKKIFDPFFTTKFTGRGLGMSAILGIIRGHQGLLFLHSQEGKGTTIKVCFPALDKLSEDEPVIQDIHTDTQEKQSVPDSTSGLERRHEHLILVIDDEEGVREMAAVMLQEAGYDVLTADGGAQGVAIFREHCEEVSLVLQDMSMPKMNGRACVQALRDIRGDVPMLLMSGYHESDFSDLGAFLGKPFSSEALLKKVAELLHA